jgi:actin related protein 2/3 complex, subunit 3
VRSEICLDYCVLLTYQLFVDIEYLRSYLTQVRQELSVRLIERLYADGTGVPSKWWMSFQKRRFMNRSLG